MISRSGLWKNIRISLLSSLVGIFLGTTVSAGGKSAKVEDFGVKGFRKNFFSSLTVTPFSQDKTIEGGSGHSRVTYTGKRDVFKQNWVTDGVEFVAYRIHKNSNKFSKAAYFPGIIGSRYSKVVKVIDGKNLIVDFEYNGGNRKKPRVSKKVSGYFFIDCSEALRKMVQNPDRPKTFIFDSNKNYVVKGMPNIRYFAPEQTQDMYWRSSNPKKHSTIKITAEDAVDLSDAGNGNVRKAKAELPLGTFFLLGTHDHSIYMNNIDIIGPTYKVPVAMIGGWGGVMFKYGSGQCARTLEIKNCNTLAEKQAYARKNIKLPAGANWAAPAFTGIISGGGKRGDRGDGVIDMLQYQYFKLIRSTWVSGTVTSLKNNDGAGNWLIIDGKDLDKNGKPVHEVYIANYAIKTRFDDVKFSFHDFKGRGKRRGIHAESPNFSWLMISNIYWDGGVSDGPRESVFMDVEGFKLYFGNTGDWRRETNWHSGDKRVRALLDAQNALIFDRIPLVGDKLQIEKAGTIYRIWGWGLQVGDVIKVNGRDYTIATRKRQYKHSTILGKKEGGYAHFWEVTFEDGAQPGNGILQATVSKSQTAFLLDGKPHTASIYYGRYGQANPPTAHWIYNRAEVNYQFRNIYYNSDIRQSAGPADGKSYQGIWEYPVKQEWVNAWAMDTDGSTHGKPAFSQRNECFGNSLQKRNKYKGAKKRNYHILVDGGRMSVRRYNTNSSPVWIRNHPEIIYGSGSYGEARICNPVMMDKKGIRAPVAPISLSLVGGYKLDLSNSIFGKSHYPPHNPVDLRVYGNGTIILNNVKFSERKNGKRTIRGSFRTFLARNLQTDVFELNIVGNHGNADFHLTGNPIDGSLKLKNWVSDGNINISDGWKSIPGFKQKFIVNGEPITN